MDVINYNWLFGLNLNSLDPSSATMIIATLSPTTTAIGFIFLDK
jgi:hypothetical protein